MTAWTQRFAGAEDFGDRAERAWRLPLGATSPLWLAYGAAAGAGVAYWWMTQWTRALNVEALAGALAATPRPLRIEIAEPKSVEPPIQVAAAATPAMQRPEEVELDLAPTPEAVAEASAPEPAAAKAADDLTRLVGVGPKLAEALAASGVTRFAQIAAWTADDLARVDAALSLKGRAVRDAWVEQARKLSRKG